MSPNVCAKSDRAHLYVNIRKLITLIITNSLTDGLLLIAEKAPQPSHPPGFPEVRSLVTSSHGQATSSASQLTSQPQNQTTSLKGQPDSDRPVLTGKEEIELGFKVCYMEI